MTTIKNTLPLIAAVVAIIFLAMVVIYCANQPISHLHLN
jgi:hypothetical protein